MEKMWNALIGLGILVSLSGLLFLPAALTPSTADEGMLAAGLALFATGTMFVTSGLYFKARALRAAIDADPNLAAIANARKRRGTCDKCRNGVALIHCTMHRVALCAVCLVQHYDTRGCVYVPAARRPVTRTATATAAGR
jgi:hypothetical protein